MLSITPRAVAIALTCLAAVASAQTPKSAEQSGKPKAPVTSVLADRATSQAFEQGLSAHGAQSGTVLEWAVASWHAYPSAHYRVQRAAQPSGPWVTIHDVASTVDTVRGLPPLANFFVRTLALRDGGARGYVVVDSSMAVDVQTPAPQQADPTGIGVKIASCSAGPGNKITLAWGRVAGITKYVVTPFMAPSGPVGAGSTVATSAHPAIVVTDTVMTYSMPVAGKMVLRLQARADYADWPQPGQSFTYLTPMPTLPGSKGSATINMDASGAHCL